MTASDIAKGLLSPSPSTDEARAAGYDAGRYHATTENCHFRFFGSRTLTSAWEGGKRAGDRDRLVFAHPVALSIRQPWAWAILNGKDIENRSWPTRFRGAIAIHAGKAFDRDGYDWLVDNAARVGFGAIPPEEYFPRGGIVGTATITDCVADHPSPWFFGPYGFVLQDACPLDLVPCRGALGFFRWA